MENKQETTNPFPSEEVTLPSKGLLYPEDSPLRNGIIEMKYMTAREEDILTNVNLIEDLWTNSSFGYPRWSKELKNNRIINKDYNSNLLYSGPDNFIDDIKGVCSNLDIKFNNKNF